MYFLKQLKRRERMACESYKQHEEVVRRLCDEFPQAVKEKDSEGRYPLYAACHQSGHHPNIILMLFNIFPQALAEKYYCYPLYEVIKNNYPEEVVLKLLNEFPQAAAEKDRHDGRYPLHGAIEGIRHGYNGYSGDVVMKLYNAFPQVVKENDNNGEYPLHLACRTKLPENVLLILLDAFPQAAHYKGRYGRYPLQTACDNEQPENFVLRLLHEFPKAAQQDDGFGDFPLHSACNNKYSEDVIVKLIKAYPQAANKRYHGHYPLHLACKYQHSEKVVLMLIGLNLMAVKYESNSNTSPLSYARESGESSIVVRVIELLMQKSDHDLKHRIDIPIIIAVHGLNNLRRIDTIQWLLINSPARINGLCVSSVSSGNVVVTNNSPVTFSQQV
jgi:Ankyrin repeats (3 copies)